MLKKWGKRERNYWVMKAERFEFLSRVTVSHGGGTMVEERDREQRRESNITIFFFLGFRDRYKI